jgi:gamma-glutamyltranspeptidase/glutathione hydrolase
MHRLLLAALIALGLAGAAQAQTAVPAFGRGERIAGAPFAGRSPVIAPNGAAATAHPLATQVAVDVLKDGGSALDAAIAANAMLGLVEPTGCGIGGDLFAIVWDPRTRKLYGYNGSGRSPLGLSLDDVRRVAREKGNGAIPSFGAASVSVPGTVDGWFALHGRFGRLPMRRILAPAIDYAERGAPIPQAIAYYWANNQRRLETEFAAGRLEDIANARATYWPGGVAPKEGDLFRNPDLARTYRALATQGRRAFYDGLVAQRTDAYMRRIGGWLRAEDFRAHRGEWVDPLCVDYRAGVALCELPPNTQGVTALQMLQILRGYDMKALGFLTADSLHVQVEAKRLAFADRARYFADPAFAPADLARLTDPHYAESRRALIRMDRAMQTPAPGPDVILRGDTTYLTTADKDGMMVSLIQSNYRGMGSGLVPDGLGFMLQNRGELFALANGHPNIYAPGKRPFQTIIPAFALKDGQPWLSFGVMGGDMQPQGHVQIILNLVDYGLDLQAAGDAARWRHGDDQEPTGEGATGNGRLFRRTACRRRCAQHLRRSATPCGPPTAASAATRRSCATRAAASGSRPPRCARTARPTATDSPISALQHRRV